MQTGTYQEMFRQIMDDKSQSYALKGALEKFDIRDPLDALNDAGMLLDLMRLKCEEIANVSYGADVDEAIAEAIMKNDNDTLNAPE